MEAIQVTKTFLPPIEEYQAFLNGIWERQWLTNNGELVQKLTADLNDYLGTSHLLPMTNGTLPIQIALHELVGEGEIITTPFSYVATTACIVWEKCVPVFVDIDPEHLTIDEKKIEEAITSETKAILATHVYGNPCDVDYIEAIAQKHNLKVIYDAAHCFGVNYKNQSLFEYGDVSTCSFHATKLFHTAEGGALFCNDEKLFKRFSYMIKFGHDGPLKYKGIGINAKMTELQAAMGLAVLPYMDSIISQRKQIVESYRLQLIEVSSSIRFLKIRTGTDWNYSYFPVIFESEDVLLKVVTKLQESNIFPRRYFYPSLTNLPYTSGNAPITEDIAKRVLCLPLYANMSDEDVCRVVKSLKTIFS